MGRADFLQLGDWNVQCYQCGRKRKGSTMKKHWQGYWVCPEHWEPRHPQDFVRNVPDDMTPPWSQPQPEPVFTIPRGTVDNLPLQEQVSWTMIWERTLSDDFSLAEGITSVTGGVYNEFTMADSVRMDVSQNPQEALGLTELVEHQVFNATQLNGFVLNGLAINSSNPTMLSVILGDGITLTEGEDETVNLKIAEGLTLTESTVSDMMTVVADTITLTEQLDILFVTPSQVNGMQLNGASVNAN